MTGQLLAIVSESLSNIVRHSRATRASLELATGPDGASWQLTIEDNGVGFVPGSAVKVGHHGLTNIRGRAAGIGATVSIDSQLAAGTRVVVRVPHRTD